MAISLLAALLLLVGLESLSVHAGGQTYNLQVPSGLEQPLNPGIPQSLMLGSQFQVEFTSNQHFRIRDVLSGNTVLERKYGVKYFENSSHHPLLALALSVNSPIISVQKRSSPLKISIKNGNAKAPEVCSLDPYFDKISLDYIGKGSTSSSSRGDDGSVIIINGDLICGRCGFRQTPIDFSLTLSLSPSKKHLEFDLKISNEYSFDLNNSVVSLNFASPRDERIFGLGKQYSYFNLKGKKVPVLVREGGIGRGKQPYTSALNSLSGEYAGE